MQCKSVFTAILATFHRQSELPAPGRLKTCISVHAPNGYATFVSLQFDMLQLYSVSPYPMKLQEQIGSFDLLRSLLAEVGRDQTSRRASKVSSGEEM